MLGGRMREQSVNLRRSASIAVLFSAVSLISGCDDGSWKSAAARYEKDILKIDRLDEECQIVEGEGKGNKFYINIIGNSFVRSGLLPLNYTPSSDYPEIVGSPLERETVHRVANDWAYAMEARDKKAVSDGIKRSVSSIEDYRAMGITDWGIDRKQYCFKYSLYSDKTKQGFEINCSYAYSPKDHTLTTSHPELFDYSTDALIPTNQPQNGYVRRDFGKAWSRTVVSEKAVCRPTSVKLR
jgi:hypothetical protein